MNKRYMEEHSLSDAYTLSSRTRESDLHIRLSGHFEDSVSARLGEVVRERYTGQGRLFVDVRELAPLRVEQQEAIRNCLTEVRKVSPQNLYFKGQNGFGIGIDGSRVLIIKKKACSCNGKCKQCACSKRLEQRHGATAHGIQTHNETP